MGCLELHAGISAVQESELRRTNVQGLFKDFSLQFHNTFPFPHNMYLVNKALKNANTGGKTFVLIRKSRYRRY